MWRRLDIGLPAVQSLGLEGFLKHVKNKEEEICKGRNGMSTRISAGVNDHR